MGSRFQGLDSWCFLFGIWIPISNRWRNFGFLYLNSGFWSPGFQIPHAKFPAFRNQEYLTSVGRGVILIICIKRSSLFIYPIQADERILNILTYVGLTLSLIGITSTIICYAFLTYVLIFKIPVKSVHLLYFVDSSVHFHICWNICLEQGACNAIIPDQDKPRHLSRSRANYLSYWYKRDQKQGIGRIHTRDGLCVWDG